MEFRFLVIFSEEFAALSLRARKNGGKAAMEGCGFFEFWGVEFQFLTIFSEEFAKLLLITV